MKLRDFRKLRFAKDDKEKFYIKLIHIIIINNVNTRNF